MAFSFTSPPTEAPIPLRQPATLRWTDNAVTIDTWLVEMRAYTMSGTVGSLLKSAYVGIYTNSNNAAAIDMQEWADDQVGGVSVDPWTVFEGGQNKGRPSSTTLQIFADNVKAFQFQIYSVTGGVKSAVQGTHNYTPIAFATNQPWEWSQDFSDYYPDAATKKGWMTSRDVESDLTIRYQMAEEDEAVVNLLQMENANYVYTGTTNLSDSDWRTINYQLYYGGVLRDTLTLTLTPGTSWIQSWITIPLGPANIKDNANWTLAYPWSSGWDYYTIQAKDAGSSPLGRAIRVDKDCRPLKHQPAQLYWIGSRGGAEILRFDGRVKDNYDVSGRETYSISNNYYESALSGVSSSDYLKYLPQRVPQTGKGKRSFVLSEDFFTDAERELFKSAVASRFMMVRYQGQWFPCRLKSTNYTHEQASSRLLPITCEVELSQDLLC